MPPFVFNEIKSGFYRDSVALMRISQDLIKMKSVEDAAVMMGTTANKKILADANLLIDKGKYAKNNDLLICVRAKNQSVGKEALRDAIKKLARPFTSELRSEARRPRSIRSAIKVNPDANFVLISVPGDFAAAEARKAINRGLNVMLFSDNVSAEDELSLKIDAREKGVLMMGPDCGTAIINGVPLGFANKVKRGRNGVVGASGTGIQEVTSLISQNGEGITHALGVGGRDLSEAIGGIATLMAIDKLEADPKTEQIILISKPPSEKVVTTLVERIKRSRKHYIVCFIGGADIKLPPNAQRVLTLKRAAEAALGGNAFKTNPFPKPSLTKNQSTIRGFYTGGTLAAEAQLLMQKAGLIVFSNVPVPGAQVLGHAKDTNQIIDFGEDEYTVGRPHPIIDPEIRRIPIQNAISNPNVGVVLVDIVIGYGAYHDPAEKLIGMLPECWDNTGPIVIASVTGTNEDPQNRLQQVKKLENAKIFVANSNADAVLAAIICVQK